MHQQASKAASYEAIGRYGEASTSPTESTGLVVKLLEAWEAYGATYLEFPVLPTMLWSSWDPVQGCAASRLWFLPAFPLLNPLFLGRSSAQICRMGKLSAQDWPANSCIFGGSTFPLVLAIFHSPKEAQESCGVHVPGMF